MESVSQIRDRIKICPEEELAKLLAEYEADGRDGVQKLLATGNIWDGFDLKYSGALGAYATE